MSDDLKIIKQAANNISEDEQPIESKEKVAASGTEERKGLGSYTRRNFRPGSSSSNQTGTNSNFKKKYFKSRSKKICYFCARGVLKIDYKDVETLKKYLNPYAKILSRRQTGNCSLHQRHLSNAIKRARVVATLPFIRE